MNKWINKLLHKVLNHWINERINEKNKRIKWMNASKTNFMNGWMYEQQLNQGYKLVNIGHKYYFLCQGY